MPVALGFLIASHEVSKLLTGLDVGCKVPAMVQNLHAFLYFVSLKLVHCAACNWCFLHWCCNLRGRHFDHMFAVGTSSVTILCTLHSKVKYGVIVGITLCSDHYLCVWTEVMNVNDKLGQSISITHWITCD
jgi:hypothetical protein